jgi:glycosyltransferase 2 family protein
MTRRENNRGKLVRAGDLASRIGGLEPGDPAIRRGLYAAIAVVLALGVGLAVVGTAHEFPDIDWTWRPVALALGIIGWGVTMLASAEVWIGILAGLGSRLDRHVGIRIWFVSGLGRFVPTSVLLPMVRIAACQRLGVRKSTCLASIVYEYAILLAAALTVGAYCLISLPGLQGHWERYLALTVPVVVLAFIQPKVFRPVTDKALTRLGREPLPEVLDGRHATALLLAYIAINATGGLSVYALAQCVYPLGSGDIPTVIGAYALGTCIGLIAFALPGGLVAREAGLAVGLSPIMPTAPAVAIALFARLTQISVEVIVVTVSLARARLAGQLDPAAEPTLPR